MEETKARKYVVKNHFKGVPKRYDFHVIEYELPPIRAGEVLVKTEWISVDPCVLAYNKNYPVPYDQFGYQVGQVIQSLDAEFPVGCRVVSYRGWCDYTILSKDPTSKFCDKKQPHYKLPDLQGLSPSLGIDALGMPGATAYLGFLEICKPKAGETVVVTGATGPIGYLVGQIAKLKGCRVIGLAGSDDKVEWLQSDLGFDKALNYDRSVDISKALKEAAPNGVDCYFDNVGGKISSIIINQMNMFGRVALCGSISAYNEDPTKMPTATIIQPAIASKQLSIEGFEVSGWSSRWPEAFVEIIQWIKSGKMKTRDHITEGFENIYDAFIGMLAGENVGKAVVKL